MHCSDDRNCKHTNIHVNGQSWECSGDCKNININGQSWEKDNHYIPKETEERHLKRIKQDCPFLRKRWFRAKDKGEMDGKNDRQLNRKVDRWINKAKENNKC